MSAHDRQQQDFWRTQITQILPQGTAVISLTCTAQRFLMCPVCETMAGDSGLLERAQDLLT